MKITFKDINTEIKYDIYHELDFTCQLTNICCVYLLYKLKKVV